MPTGDLAAVRRLAIVFIDPPGAFPSPTASVRDALLDAAPHLFFDTVGSSIGAMYLQFNSFEDREACVALRFLPYEGARISFIREKEVDRVVPRAGTLAFISATQFPADHFNHIGIARAFSGFGDLVEIDHRVLTGEDLSVVRVVLLIEHARAV